MKRKAIFIFLSLLIPVVVFAAGAGTPEMNIAGIPLEFILFGGMLLGIALLPDHTTLVAAVGLAAILILKIFFLHFDIADHLRDETPELLNLLGLLLGFAILAKLFEDSHLPKALPKIMPDNWKGPFLLLVMVFVLSSFLDNIAAALIGGSIALVVFRGKVHIGYLAAIVAASNGGGAGSVVGDTTTTMMWVDGVAPVDVLHAYLAAVPALLFFGIIASRLQQSYHPMIKGPHHAPKIDVRKLVVCFFVLVGAIVANFALGLPAIGVWVAILLGAFVTRVEWEELQKAIPGSIFLLLQMLAASLMPVDKLPPASWQSALAMGFVSSVFNNIPLTKLALDQGGYDWGVLAYCVGFGGSMIWFGSSAGVAICSMFPEARSVVNWVKKGWFVAAAYVVGFAVLIGILGWHPHAPHKDYGDPDIEIVSGDATGSVSG